MLFSHLKSQLNTSGSSLVQIIYVLRKVEKMVQASYCFDKYDVLSMSWNVLCFYIKHNTTL